MSFHLQQHVTLCPGARSPILWRPNSHSFSQTNQRREEVFLSRAGAHKVHAVVERSALPIIVSSFRSP